MMEKEASPRQLDLPLDSSVTEVASETKSTVLSPCEQPAVVLDFASARADRQAAMQAKLYRQILDTVRHLG